MTMKSWNEPIADGYLVDLQTLIHDLEMVEWEEQDYFGDSESFDSE